MKTPNDDILFLTNNIGVFPYVKYDKMKEIYPSIDSYPQDFIEFVEFYDDNHRFVDSETDISIKMINIEWCEKNDFKVKMTIDKY